jgi:hypothetical protein
MLLMYQVPKPWLKFNLLIPQTYSKGACEAKVASDTVQGAWGTLLLFFPLGKVVLADLS